MFVVGQPDADVDDSASMQRCDIIESLLPTQNERLKKYFSMLKYNKFR